MNKKRWIPDIITPNRITYFRLLLIPVFVLFFLSPSIPCNFFIAAGIFGLAALTDLADGIIARKYNLVSNLGKFLDPIADKVLVSTALILLLTQPFVFNRVVWGANISSQEAMEISVGYNIAVICICIIMARELIISGFRQVAATTGLVLAADKLGKYKTTFQDISVAFLLLALGFFSLHYEVGYWFALIGFFLLIIATALTIISGISYIVKNEAVLKS